MYGANCERALCVCEMPCVYIFASVGYVHVMCAEKNQTTDDEQQRAKNKTRTHNTAKRERCLRDCVDCSHFMRPEYEAKIAHNVFIITTYIYTHSGPGTQRFGFQLAGNNCGQRPRIWPCTQPNVVAFYGMRPDQAFGSGCWSLGHHYYCRCFSVISLRLWAGRIIECANRVYRDTSTHAHAQTNQ